MLYIISNYVFFYLIKNFYKLVFIILLFINYYIISYTNRVLNKVPFNYPTSNKNKLNVIKFNEIYNNTIENGTVLIFEPNLFHHECTPGYAKYFLDLGYKVDILMYPCGIDSLLLFSDFNNIKVIIFNDLKEILIRSKNYSSIIKNYDFILLQTTTKYEMNIYNQLDLFNINNSFFVFHILNFVNSLGCSKYLKENRIWTLGNFSKGLQVNPHYFGDIKIRRKNEKTTFFLTSSNGRNYTHLISTIKKLYKENYDFQIFVIGRARSLNSKIIPKNLIKIFKFMYNVKYSELYQTIENSDYIILPLDPNSKYDFDYNYTKSSGSIQLSYGFLKPPIISKEYSYVYKLNENNSLIYNKSNFYEIMKKSIELTKKDYKYLQKDLMKCEKEVYSISIDNIKLAINKN